MTTSTAQTAATLPSNMKATSIIYTTATCTMSTTATTTSMH